MKDRRPEWRAVCWCREKQGASHRRHAHRAQLRFAAPQRDGVPGERGQGRDGGTWVCPTEVQMYSVCELYMRQVLCTGTKSVHQARAFYAVVHLDEVSSPRQSVIF